MMNKDTPFEKEVTTRCWGSSLFCTVHPLIELSPRFYHQQLVPH